MQEELQNLLRSLASRAVNLRQLASVALAWCWPLERLLANILLGAGGDVWSPVAAEFSVRRTSACRLIGRLPLNGLAMLALVLVIGLRGQYGAL